MKRVKIGIQDGNMINLLEKLLYCNIKASDIFKKIPDEEINQRQQEFTDLRRKQMVEEFLSYISSNCIKNADGTYNCTKNIIIKQNSANPFTKLPIKFKEVAGHFICFGVNLKTLEGCPEKVGGNFDCSRNKLISLEYGPKEVGGKYDCSKNRLISLAGAPEIINKTFDCSNNLLSTLENAPKEINGDFICSNNKLSSLKSLSSNIKGKIDCTNNILNSKLLLKTLENKYD